MYFASYTAGFTVLVKSTKMLQGINISVKKDSRKSECLVLSNTC